MMNINIVSLGILLSVAGMLSTIGCYLSEDKVVEAMFYGLALVGQVSGVLVVYLEYREAKMWKEES